MFMHQMLKSYNDLLLINYQLFSSSRLIISSLSDCFKISLSLVDLDVKIEVIRLFCFSNLLHIYIKLPNDETDGIFG